MLSAVRSRAAVISPALALLAFIAFIGQVGVAVMLPLLPLFATELGASPFVLGLLTSLFAITNAIGQLGAGVGSDRFGARRFLSAGLGLYAAMNALIATATTAFWLVAWRGLAGFGGGAFIVSERIYLTEITESRRRAFANGVLSAAASAGMVAGPAFGGFLAELGGLRAPFVVVAVTSGIALAASVALPRRRVAAEVDPAPAARIDGQDSSNEQLDRGAILALLFANLALLAGYGAFITTYAPLATQRLGWTTVDVGLAFSFFGAGSILLGPWLAHVADRTSRKAVAMAGIIPVSMFGFALVVALPVWAVFGLAFVGGAGLTAFNASWYALLADVSGTRTRGRIFGIVSAVSNAGIVIGATVAAQLWERVDIAVAMSFGGFAILAGLVPMLLLRPPPAARAA